MFIMLNGAFGIGKTTAARALLGQMPNCRLYDPEPVGVALQRASAFLRPADASTISKISRRGG